MNGVYWVYTLPETNSSHLMAWMVARQSGLPFGVYSSLAGANYIGSVTHLTQKKSLGSMVRINGSMAYKLLINKCLVYWGYKL